MEWRQKMIQDVFGGDKNRFEKAYSDSVDDAIQNAVSWQNLFLNETVLPDLEKKAKDLIEARLGYLPPVAITIRYEYHLRKLIQSFDFGSINQDDFYTQADQFIKLIRNDDVEPNDCLSYEPHLYEKYKSEYLPYVQMAKGRIMNFLGYEPQLDCSLIAEIWLGSILGKDTLNLPDYITPIDFKALTIIKYREVLFSHGKEDADYSPLLCCRLLD